MKTTYPVTFSVDFPDRDLDRVSTAFRIFAVIPIGIILSLLSGASIRYVTSTNGTNETVTSRCLRRSCEPRCNLHVTGVVADRYDL